MIEFLAMAGWFLALLGWSVARSNAKAWRKSTQALDDQAHSVCQLRTELVYCKNKLDKIRDVVKLSTTV